MEKKGGEDTDGMTNNNKLKLRFERFRINRRLLDRSFEMDAKKSWIVKKKRDSFEYFQTKTIFFLRVSRLIIRET